MNMKKEYMKPEISVVEIEMMAMLASSPSDVNINDNHADEELSNRRRNFWDEVGRSR